ncbi:MAG: hypothetical protein IKW86_04520 [Salinivirgaceae bacterium]|nr:hypothetical protein [Salinivirgaceae bacterium]
MKRLFCFLFACGLVLSAKADDGGASYPEDWTYGNIYVKEPNKSIALEKEYMYVSGDKIEAVFCFRNTTDSIVVVPCAFPIVVKMPFRLENDTVMIGDYNSENDTVLWKIALGDDAHIKRVGFSDKQLQMTKSEIEKYDKKLRVLKYSEYQALYKQWMESDENEKYYKGCSIVQDGNSIELKNVGIETNVIFNESDKKYEFGSEVDLVLHFYHELKFQPNSLSKVCVDYFVNTPKLFYKVNSYQLFYDISTGATWKDGIIGSFVLLTDYNMNGGGGLKETKLIPYSIYSERNYRPVGRFSFYGYDEYSNEWMMLEFPGENQTHNHMSLLKNNSGGFEIEGKTDANFAPIVIDNKFKFNVDEPYIGPFVANGFIDYELSRNNQNLFAEEYKGLEPDVPKFPKDSLWGKYSRIKTAILTNIDEGWTDTLELEDRFPAYPYEVNSNFNDGWFGSNAVRNVRLLRPGSYSLTVNDIYRGDSTESAGVSHIWFYPVDKTLVSIIYEDKNSAMSLFSDVWKILNVTVDGVKPNWNDEDENGSDSIEIEEQEQKQESPAEQQVVKTDADESKSAVLFVVVALVALSVLAVVIVVVRKRKSRSK